MAVSLMRQPSLSLQLRKINMETEDEDTNKQSEMNKQPDKREQSRSTANDRENAESPECDREKRPSYRMFYTKHEIQQNMT